MSLLKMWMTRMASRKAVKESQILGSQFRRYMMATAIREMVR